MKMRTLSSILSLAAALPLLLAVSCRKEGEAVSGGPETAVLSFEVSTLDAQTKSAGTYDLENPPTVEERETIHDDLDIFVFDASTGDLAYQRHHSTEPLTVTAKGKTYNVYAVANMNTRNTSLYTTITKESELTSLKVSFGGQDALVPGTQVGAYSYLVNNDDWDEKDPSHFLMVSEKRTVTVYSQARVELNLRRTVSKLCVTGAATLVSGFQKHFVETRYTVGAGYELGVDIRGPFICSVPRTFGLFVTGAQATTNSANTWRTRSTYPTFADGGLNTESMIGYPVGWDYNTYSPGPFVETAPGSAFYVSENAAPALTAAERSLNPSATDCCTKLLYIVAITAGDGDDFYYVDFWYYPIAVPNIGRNEVYRIRNVTITGPGSDDPYVYPGDNSNYSSNISYSIEVKDWSTGRLSKIISGGLNQVDEGTSAITI